MTEIDELLHDAEEDLASHIRDARRLQEAEPSEADHRRLSMALATLRTALKELQTGDVKAREQTGDIEQSIEQARRFLDSFDEPGADEPGNDANPGEKT